MSQDNVETVRRVAEAFNHRDVAGVVEELDPEVEWHPAMQALVGGNATVYRGPEGVREMMRDFYDTFADIQLEVWLAKLVIEWCLSVTSTCGGK